MIMEADFQLFGKWLKVKQAKKRATKWYLKFLRVTHPNRGNSVRVWGLGKAQGIHSQFYISKSDINIRGEACHNQPGQSPPQSCEIDYRAG